MEDAGPKPTRANVFAALQKIDTWDGHGVLSPAGPASKRPAVCFIFIRVNGGKFERFESPPPKFRCENSQFVFNR
jgi:hypothetical protein